MSQSTWVAAINAELQALRTEFESFRLRTYVWVTVLSFVVGGRTILVMLGIDPPWWLPGW